MGTLFHEGDVTWLYALHRMTSREHVPGVSWSWNYLGWFETWNVRIPLLLWSSRPLFSTIMVYLSSRDSWNTWHFKEHFPFYQIFPQVTGWDSEWESGCCLFLPAFRQTLHNGGTLGPQNSTSSLSQNSLDLVSLAFLFRDSWLNYRQKGFLQVTDHQGSLSGRVLQLHRYWPETLQSRRFKEPPSLRGSWQGEFTESFYFCALAKKCPLMVDSTPQGFCHWHIKSPFQFPTVLWGRCLFVIEQDNFSEHWKNKPKEGSKNKLDTEWPRKGWKVTCSHSSELLSSSIHSIDRGSQETTTNLSHPHNCSKHSFFLKS